MGSGLCTSCAFRGGSGSGGPPERRQPWSYHGVSGTTRTTPSGYATRFCPGMWGGRESTGGGAAPEAHAGRRRPAGVAYVGCRRSMEPVAPEPRAPRVRAVSAPPGAPVPARALALGDAAAPRLPRPHTVSVGAAAYGRTEHPGSGRGTPPRPPRPCAVSGPLTPAPPWYAGAGVPTVGQVHLRLATDVVY